MVQKAIERAPYCRLPVVRKKWPAPAAGESAVLGPSTVTSTTGQGPKSNSALYSPNCRRLRERRVLLITPGTLLSRPRARAPRPSSSPGASRKTKSPSTPELRSSATGANPSMDTRARRRRRPRGRPQRAGGAGLFEMGAPGSNAASLDAVIGSPRALFVSRSKAL